LVAGAVALVATGVGAFAVAGSKLALTAASVAKFAFLAAGTATLTSTVFFGPKTPRSQLSRLNVSLDPSTGRKAVLGTTAMPLDLRYHEASGTDQEFIDYIIALAAHKVASIDEIYFEEKLAWTSLGGVTATYTGYLTVTTITEGTAGNAAPVNAGTVWDASCRLTGCAYVRIRIKRSGNSKKTESPLVQGLPSRVTIIGEGAPLYDPRLDSTVPGGSGSHRANDQATWGAYAGADHYDNPALQVLWFLLGWKINGKLSVGAGVPPARIDMESFITAANICDEDITLATGGTQKRYRTSATVSDEDGRMDTINTFLACMNGTLRDSGGKLTLALLKNDLADPVLDFTDGDFLGEFAWDQTGGGLSQGHNIIRGRFVDPSTQSLYQMAEYPEVSLPSPDGIERVMTFDVPFVEDGRRAQRLAKQVLQRQQFRGQLSAEFNAKALGCEVGHIVTITLSALGFNNKPFRVISKEVRVDGRVPLALLEESSLIYQWDRDDRAPVVARTPVVYDPLLNMITQGDEAVQAIAEQALQEASDAITAAATAQATADGKVTTFYQSAPPTAEEIGDLWIDTDDDRLYRWSGTAWIEIQDADIAQAIADAASAQATADGKIVSFYQNEPPTAGAVGDFWIDTNDSNKLYRWNGSAWQTARDAGIEAAISAAATAQSTADGKILTFYQDAPPGGGTLGDLWFDTNDGNKLYRHNGIDFIEARDDGIAQAITDAAGAQATADGKVTTFYSASAPTAEGVGDLWYDTDDKVLYRWDGTDWTDSVSDITAANQITFSEVDPFTIQADSTGTTTTTLPVTRGIKVFRGNIEQTSGVTVGTVTTTAGLTASASVSGGFVTVSLSVANAVGYITVPVIFGGVTYPRLIIVNRVLAAPIAGGSSGSTSFTDQTWVQVSSTSFAQVTDADAQIVSDSSGQIRFQASASYEGVGTAEIKTQYSADNSTWTDVASATGTVASNDPFEPNPGFVIVGPTTVTGLTASTNYYVRLVARETTSAANFSWTSPSFTANHP
jgi:hypothetical protein